MNLFSMLSDDQVAIIGCFVALVVCVLIAMISSSLGPVGRDVKKATSDTAPRATSQSSRSVKAQERRAA
jgi:hypothetical protein